MLSRTEPQITPDLLQFLNTQDLLRLSQVCHRFHEWTSASFAFLNVRDGRLRGVVSTFDKRETFVHTLFTSISHLRSFLSLLESSGIHVPHIQYVETDIRLMYSSLEYRRPL
jgi:hypothetical protein